MANQVKLPRLGQGMEAGTVTKWLKAEGEQVEKGEPLFEVDTDKVTQEVESDFAGVLLKIALEAGEAPVGQTIAWIGEEGEQIADAPVEPIAPAEAGPPAEAAPPPKLPVRRAGRRRRRRGVRRLAAAPEPHPAPRRTVRGSRHRRWRAASPVSAASSCRRCAARAPRAGSSPRTSSALRRRRARVGRAGGRSRVRPADEDPQDDRPPPDGRLAGARVPAHRERRHDAGERARREVRAS